ncbi:hypothetical protein C7534_12538 [Pseudomonas sp. OV226]|nr:hypothetical protein C7534_12538 [Pseudomonas sp. OV226]
MPDSRLAPTNPAEYHFAVHSCGYKWEQGLQPDRAVALFADSAAALRFGKSMWSTTFEVIDITTGERVCA